MKSVPVHLAQHAESLGFSWQVMKYGGNRWVRPNGLTRYIGRGTCHYLQRWGEGSNLNKLRFSLSKIGTVTKVAPKMIIQNKPLTNTKKKPWFSQCDRDSIFFLVFQITIRNNSKLLKPLQKKKLVYSNPEYPLYVLCKWGWGMEISRCVGVSSIFEWKKGNEREKTWEENNGDDWMRRWSRK